MKDEGVLLVPLVMRSEPVRIVAAVTKRVGMDVDGRKARLLRKFAGWRTSLASRKS